MTKLNITELDVVYHTRRGELKAVEEASLTIEDGEIFGIVGESGSGKSTLAKSIIGLLSENGEIINGEIWYEDTEISRLTDKELSRDIRGEKISMVFQDASASLDPVYTIGSQIVETLRANIGMSSKEARKRAIQLLGDVGISSPEKRLSEYPHTFSGGMRQRAVLAIALSCNPGLLIADEPTTGLDVTIQSQILDLMKDLQKEFGTSIMYISHDLGTVAEICDRIAVMYAGSIVEVGTVRQVYENPKHPYTQALLRSLPERHEFHKELYSMPGSPPDLVEPPMGCKFHPRCEQICGKECESEDIPPMYTQGDTDVRCYLYADDSTSPTQQETGGDN